MNSILDNLSVILGFQLTMGLPEIIICELGALILGFTIHFFWNSKRSLRISEPSQNAGISDNDNWKLKYYNDMDMQERAQQQLRERLSQRPGGRTDPHDRGRGEQKGTRRTPRRPRVRPPSAG
ncbi:hypothetical protein ACQ86N_46485 [Puia sp. P3]|uniref:hypothetical protein n=1 Tax=Puia sp. P3 TaxID=3423952 RepID=UPI003D666E21